MFDKDYVLVKIICYNDSRYYRLLFFKEEINMGLFDKLFSKKEKEPVAPKKDEIIIEKPYGRFKYFATPNVNEYGYENFLTGEDGEINVYLETDSPDTTEASFCFGKYEEFLSDKENRIYEVSKIVNEYFLHKPDLLPEGQDEEKMMEETELTWMGFFRNGDVQYDFFSVGAYVDDAMLTVKNDGHMELKYKDYNHEEHIENL